MFNLFARSFLVNLNNLLPAVLEGGHGELCGPYMARYVLSGFADVIV
jgi:hypothetical protein